MHVELVLEAEAEDQEPALQFAHTFTDEAPIVIEKEPLGQAKQKESEPAAVMFDHVPALQDVQACDEEAPNSNEYDP